MVEQRNIYKGHRYVPKIMGEWNQSESYEGLSIVTNEGNSYTSKKRVPVGVNISNEEYWTITGNYNAQIEEYRQDVKRHGEDLSAFKEDTTEQLAQKVQQLLNSDLDDYTNIVNSLLESPLQITKGVYPIQNFADTFNKSNISIVGSNPEDVEFVGIQTEEEGAIQYLENCHFENLTFTNFTRFRFMRCKNIKFKNCHFKDFSIRGLLMQFNDGVEFDSCSFENIGYELTSYTNDGKAIQIQGSEEFPAKNTHIHHCTFEETKGNGAVFIMDRVDDFVVENNTFKNTVWGGINCYNLVSKGGLNRIERNTLTNIGLGTPADGDTIAATSGVGCSAIYCKGDGQTINVQHNYIENCVENGIEGNYRNVKYNTIINTGVNSDVRKTPSIEGIYISEVNNELCIIEYNYVSALGRAILFTTKGSFEKIRINHNTLMCGSNQDIWINFEELDELMITNNRLNNIYISSVKSDIFQRNYELNRLIIDNATTLELPRGIVFRHGYVDLKNGQKFDDSFFFNTANDWDISHTDLSTIANNEVTLNRSGDRIGDIYQTKQKNTITRTTPILYMTINYKSDNPADIDALGIKFNDIALVNGEKRLTGTNGESVTKKILLSDVNKSKTKESKLTVDARISNAGTISAIEATVF